MKLPDWHIRDIQLLGEPDTATRVERDVGRYPHARWPVQALEPQHAGLQHGTPAAREAHHRDLGGVDARVGGEDLDSPVDVVGYCEQAELRLVEPELLDRPVH